ncbi:MAG: hypothetical protein J6T01_05865 [Kiritimatiellae bacterium]|nr:hypothetical protein [Kiritimatiellia bacterium]
MKSSSNYRVSLQFLLMANVVDYTKIEVYGEWTLFGAVTGIASGRFALIGSQYLTGYPTFAATSVAHNFSRKFANKTVVSVGGGTEPAELEIDDGGFLDINGGNILVDSAGGEK